MGGALEAWLSQDTASSRADINAVVLGALVFAALQKVMFGTVFEYAGRYFVPAKGLQGKKLPAKDLKRIDKFKESCWKFFVYLGFTMGLLYAMHDEDWFFNTRKYWEGLPGPQIFKMKLKLVYIAELSFYVYCVPGLLIWETKRKDFTMMMIHHWITIYLVGVSLCYGYQRVGAVIMLVHDACDVFLESAKIFKYARNELMANVLFATFTLSWMVLRLMIYPYFCVGSALFESVRVMGEPPVQHKYFSICLVTLQVMHVYWFYMIVNMIIKALGKGGVQEDYRSDDEDD